MKSVVLCLVALAAAGCARRSLVVEVPGLTKEFLHSSLALSPVAATAAGLHTFQGRSLDLRLDDWSNSGVEARGLHWDRWKRRLGRVTLPQDAQELADLEVMRRQAELELFELKETQPHRWNPTFYVESLGNALFTPWTVDYAPADERWQHILSRLRSTRAFFAQARGQMEAAPAIWVETAQRENEGNIALVDTVLRPAVPPALRQEFDLAASDAIDAMREFNKSLEAVRARKEMSWRLGPERYRRKLALTLGEGVTPEALLANAEAELKATRRRMFDLALPLHKKYYPSHVDPVDLNLIVGEVLDVIARKHPARDRYFAEAEAMLAEARSFVAAHQDALAPLPPSDNLKIIPTPEFMRGVYSVGGFNPAPPLEPKLGAFYWLTPFGPKEPPASVESRLREYNKYGLRILTLHEAIPGHYMQAEYAARIPAEDRRALRAVYGSGVYVEGWAVYSNAMMLRAGYLDNDPELQLTFDKQMLRVLGNTILDVKLHTGSMSDEEAIEFMRKQTFQEEREAQGKLLRAKLGAVQLTTYFAGYREWMKLREDAEKKAGGSFSAREFHVRALEAGALPMPVLRRVLGL